METKKFTMDMFLADGDLFMEDLSFEGLDLGGHWNGWSRPVFTKDVADEIMIAINKWARKYDSYEEDEILFIVDDDGEWYVDTYGGEGYESYFGTTVIDGITYYCLGTGIWMWYEAKDN